MKKLGIIGVAIFIFTVSASILCAGEEMIINGCYHKKSGYLRIVNNQGKCYKSEIPISWNLKGPRGPQGPVGPQGPPGGVRVFDANGQYLGIFQGYEGGGFAVFHPTLSRSVWFDGGTGELHIGWDLLFESDNCTGPPYISAGASYLVVMYMGKTYGGDKAIPDLRNIRSQSNWVSGSCRAIGPPLEIPVVKAIEIILPFSTPVALPMEFRY